MTILPLHIIFDIMSYVEYRSDSCSDIVLIVPFKNESGRLHQLIKKINEQKIMNHVDVLLVDGGSTDDSLDENLFRNLGVKGLISFKNAKGLGEQLRAGFQWSIDRQYKSVITIDSNGKDDPIYISRIIDKLKEDYDFVQASRYCLGGAGINTPIIRHLAIKYIHVPLLRYASGFMWTDTTQGFRGYAVSLLKDPRLDLFRDVFIKYEILFYLSYRAPLLGYRCIEVPVLRTYPLGAIPTKIKGIKSDLQLLWSLIKVCAGFYNP